MVNFLACFLKISYFFIKKLCKFFFQDYIARFGHGSAKLARQAQSKEKTLAKMIEGGLTQKVQVDKVRLYTFEFIFCFVMFCFIIRVFLFIRSMSDVLLCDVDSQPTGACEQRRHHA